MESHEGGKGVDLGFVCSMTAVGMDMGVRTDSSFSTWVSSNVNG